MKRSINLVITKNIAVAIVAFFASLLFGGCSAEYRYSVSSKVVSGKLTRSVCYEGIGGAANKYHCKQVKMLDSSIHYAIEDLVELCDEDNYFPACYYIAERNIRGRRLTMIQKFKELCENNASALACDSLAKLGVEVEPKYLKMACDSNYGYSCIQLKAKTILDSLEKACNNKKDANSCMKLYLAYYNGGISTKTFVGQSESAINIPTNRPKGLMYQGKACKINKSVEMEMGTTCSDAARDLIKNNSTDASLGVELLTKYCYDKDFFSCRELASYYYPSQLKQAKIFYGKACDLFNLSDEKTKKEFTDGDYVCKQYKKLKAQGY